MVAKGVLLALALALLAGCGGTEHPRPGPPPATTTATAAEDTDAARPCTDQRLHAARQRRRGDACRGAESARADPERNTGDPTDDGRVIEDLEKSHLTLKAKNRMIDHAAGAVSTSCDQCFQQLEAIRPIPQIANPH